MAEPNMMVDVISAAAPLPGAAMARETGDLRSTVIADGDITLDNYFERGERLVQMARRLNEVEAKEAELLAPFKEGIDGIRSFFRTPKAQLNDAIALEKSRILEYDSKREAAIKAEQDELLRRANNEQRRLAKLAEKATQRGDVDRAAELEQQAIRTVAPIVPSGPKAPGQVIRKVWNFRIVDPKLIPRRYLKVDDVKIRRQVNATHEETDIPGVEVFEDKQLAVRQKR